MMFGYATDETEQFMPAPIFYAHGLVRRLAEVRHDGVLPWLKPDGKAQVSIRYEDGVPSSVDAIVVSAQHDKLIDGDDDSSINKEHRMIKDRIISEVIEKVIPLEWLHGLDANKIHVNPTKRFVTGGPEGDAGLTGRKIIVDTYGGMGRHGGGAFSGKDATKVDRSGAYAARWAARSLVEAGAAKRCEIQLAYAIGVKEPVSVYVNNFETGSFTNNELERIVKDVFDFRPESIIRDLNLRKAIFFPTSTYGHFGRKSVTKVLDTGESVDLFPWESSGKVQDIQTALKM
jgi:S-adenosylmethionine synthetase